MAKVRCKRLAQQSSDKKQMSKQQGRGANLVQTDPQDSEDGSDTDLSLYQVSSKSSHPITGVLKVNKRKLNMKIDTRAAVSVISERIRKKIFPDVALSKSAVLLKIYTVMPVLGEMNVEYKYGSQTAMLTLTVVEGQDLAFLEETG